jgi:hypothetical protein
MPTVHGLHCYLGKSLAAKNAKVGQNLHIKDDGFLCKRFRRSLLESSGEPKAFRSRIALPELPPLDIRWIGVGQTAGVAIWERAGKIGAASILANGVECDGEVETAKEVLAAHRLSIPQKIWKTLAAEPKPLILTAYFDLYTYTDPVIASAAPALANAFFTLFGTSG